MLIISGILNFDNNIYETIIYWILLNLSLAIESEPGY